MGRRTGDRRPGRGQAAGRQPGQRGITVNISSREDVMKAYEAAREHRRHILVERYLPGHDFRFLVIGKQLVAAAPIRRRSSATGSTTSRNWWTSSMPTRAAAPAMNRR